MTISHLKIILKQILARRLIVYFVLFLSVFCYFFWLTLGQSFADPDSFYHAKIIELIRDSGLVKNFPWLPFTTLDQVFIDHHLLYHLLLVPFAYFWSALLVVKYAAVFFAALAIVIFQFLLDHLKIKYSFLYTFILIFSDQFIFRLNLAKAPSLSLIFILFALYFIAKDPKKFSWPLAFLSFVYVWLYGGWPILFGVGLIYFIVFGVFQWLEGINKNKSPHSAKPKPTGGQNLRLLFLSIFSWSNLKLPLSIFSGLLAGLIINPYFPKNLLFYWQQTFEIGLINYKNIVAVGAEWYSLSIFDLVGRNIYTLMFFFVSLVLFFIFVRRQKNIHWLLLFLGLIFFVLTLKSQRNIEYFVPLALIFSALVFNSLTGLKAFLLSVLATRRFLSTMVIFILLFCAPIIFSYNFFSLKRALSAGYPFDSFSDVSAWLQTNTPKKSIIFHDDWGSFPPLFYHNSNNYYLVGLDPTFMYFQNKEQYLLWADIVDGRRKERVCSLIKNNFSATYILVKKTNQSLWPKLALDQECVKVYEDDQVYLYHFFGQSD